MGVTKYLIGSFFLKHLPSPPTSEKKHSMLEIVYEVILKEGGL